MREYEAPKVTSRDLDDLVEHPCGCVEFQIGGGWGYINCSEHGGGSGATLMDQGVESPGDFDTIGE